MRPLTRERTVLATVAGMTLALTVWCLGAPQVSPLTGVAPKGTDATTPTTQSLDAAPSSQRSAAAHTGDRLRLEQRLTLRLGIGGDPSTTAQTLDLRHRGTMLVVPMATDGDGTATLVRFEEVTTVAAGLAEDAPQRRDVELDERPFVVLRDPAGIVTGYRFAADLPETRRNSARSLIAATNFASAPIAHRTWTCEEPDANGMRRHAYARDPVTPAVIRRRLLAAPGDESAQLERGTACAEFAADRLLVARVDEAWRMAPDDGQFAAAVAAAVELERVASDVDATGALAELARLTLVDAPAIGSPVVDDAAFERAELERWQQQLVGVDLARAIVDLRAVLGGEPAAIFEAWERLHWLLTLRPACVAEVLALLATPDIAPELASRLITALGAARGDAARQVLFGLLAAPRSEFAEIAATAFIQADHPDADLLARLSDHLPRGTRLTEASATLLRVIGGLAERVPDRAAATASLLALEGRLHPDDLPIWHTALGNTGRREVLPTLEQGLAAGDPEVRANAARALRRIPGEDVSATLARLATMDPDGSVRFDAIAVLGRRQDQASERALHELATTAGSAAPRIAALQAWARRGLDRPGVRELVQAAAVDPDAAVARAAQELLRAR